MFKYFSELPFDNHFLTNIDKEYKEPLLKAANELALNIWWEDNATDGEGYPLSRYVAVYTTEIKDLTEFWNLYDQYRDVENG